MIIFMKGKLETLNYFIDEMAKGTEDAVFLNSYDKDFSNKIRVLDSAINEDTHVITFNNIGIKLMVGNVNYWEMKRVKLHNIQVDAAAWYIDTLDLNLKCMQIISIDRYHNQYVKRYYPIYETSKFLPHGGVKMEESIRKYEDREIDVIYLGGMHEVHHAASKLDMFADQGKELYEIFYQTMWDNPNIAIETIMEIYTRDINPNLSDEMQRECMQALYEFVVNNIRSVYQEKIISVLAENGIPVTIYSGGGWKKLQEKYPEYIKVEDRVSSEECIRLIGNSKICLNIQPWFKAGAHERIYNAMLNEAVCVTDTSEYLLENFENGYDIVFYELDKLEDLAADIKYLLQQPDYAKFIIENQKKRVEQSLWSNRLQNIILDKFEAGKDFV